MNWVSFVHQPSEMKCLYWAIVRANTGNIFMWKRLLCYRWVALLLSCVALRYFWVALRYCWVALLMLSFFCIEMNKNALTTCANHLILLLTKNQHRNFCGVMLKTWNVGFLKCNFLLLNDVKELISYKCSKLWNLITTLTSELYIYLE